jgi:hypothetical protein
MISYLNGILDTRDIEDLSYIHNSHQYIPNWNDLIHLISKSDQEKSDVVQKNIQYWNILIHVGIKSCKWESTRSHSGIVCNISICIVGSCMKCCCIRNIRYLFIILFFMFDLPWGLRYIVI